MAKMLVILCGVPASGKSTWAKNMLKKHEDEHILYVSRDEIRFNLLSDEDDYFSKEDEVFTKFVDTIQSGLDDELTSIIIADATHLNEKSRNKLLDRLNISDNILIVPVSFLCGSLERLLDRNDKREGKAKVPKGVVKRMFYQFQPPTNNEKYKYFDIIDMRT